MLNNHQKAYLRSLANRLSPTVTVGKEGMTDTLIESLENSLTAHELVKVSVLKSCPMPVQELKIEFEVATHSEIVQVIGKNVILFRHRPKDGMALPK